MIRLLLCLSVHFALNSTTLGQSAPWDDVPLVKVTEVTLPTSVLKGKWKSSDGVQIEDLSKANRQLPGRRELIEALEKTGPNGLRSVADYTLVATGFPLNTVTVRVFIFEETSQCEEWWKKKYEGDGWDKQYEKLDYADVAAVRSLQSPKIAASFGRVWITSHQLRSGDEHEQAARYVIEQLTKGKRSLTKP